MHKVFINVARGLERAPLSLSLSKTRPRLSLLASRERESALPLPLSLAACGKQRLINGLQAQARIPGSFLMDSGNSSNYTRPLRGGRRVGGKKGERERVEFVGVGGWWLGGKGVRAIKSERRGWREEEYRESLDGGKRGWTSIETNERERRGRVKLANNLNSPFKSRLCLCERK